MESESSSSTFFDIYCLAVTLLLVQLIRLMNLYKAYKEHRTNYLRLTSDRKQRLEAIRNPKPLARPTKRRPGRPTDAERKRRAEAERRAAELKQHDNT